MRRLLCLLWFLAPSAWAAGPLGLGFVLVDPTGLSGNYYYEKQRSLSLALGWGDGDVRIHADHLWYRNDLIVVDRIPIDTYAGIGLRLHQIDHERKDDETKIGVRVPLGVAYLFRKIPLQVFGELAPGIILVDESDFIVDVALGLRYYF